MAAEADAAVHVPLHREVDPLRPGRPRSSSASIGRAHHDLGPADERRRPLRPERRALHELRDEPDRPGPLAAGRVDGDRDVDRLAPLLELLDVEEVGRRARAVEDGDRAVVGSARSSACSTTGRSGASPIPPATTTTSPPAAASTGQDDAERAAQPEHRARLRGADRARHRADRAHGQHDRPGPAGGPLTEIGTSPIPKA